MVSIKTETLEELKARYNLVISSESDILFYQNTHHYFDLIMKTPELKKVWDDEIDDLRNKQIILDDRTDLTDCQYNELLEKQERFSFYHYGAKIFYYIYDLIEEYKISDDPQIFQEPDVLLMLKGPSVFKYKKWYKRLFNILPKVYVSREMMLIQEGSPYRTKKSAIEFLHKRRIYIESRLKQFHTLFVSTIYEINKLDSPEIKTERILISESSQLFSFKINTGDFKFEGEIINFSPATQEYRFLKCLFESDSNTSTYLDLTKSVFPYIEIEKIGKSHKDKLSEILKKIKGKLNILPKTKKSKQDIFVNIQKYGYKLIENSPKLKP